MLGMGEVRAEVKTEDACAVVVWFLIRKGRAVEIMPIPDGYWSIAVRGDARRELARAVALAEVMD